MKLRFVYEKAGDYPKMCEIEVKAKPTETLKAGDVVTIEYLKNILKISSEKLDKAVKCS